MRHALTFLTVTAIALSAAAVTANSGSARKTPQQNAALSAKSASPALSYSFDGMDGRPIDLRQYAGKAILVVNTASQCGFTSQYTGLEKLWKTYGPRGLVVLAVPSNDFGGQEPGSNAEIKQFCENVYAVDFPVTAKTDVKGTDAHPFYRYAAQKFGAKSLPKWNFHKYLIDAKGNLTAWFPSELEPNNRSVTQAIERALPVRPTASLEQENIY